MEQLIKTFTKEDGAVAVNGRDLHDFLQVDTPYQIWLPRMIDLGQFDENVDYSSFVQKSTKPKGGRPLTNHALTLDMAKEVSMLQRNDRGKQARQYFLDMERIAQTSMKKMTATDMLKLQSKSLIEIDERVTNLEDNQPIGQGEYVYIARRVSQRVHEVAKAYRISKDNLAELFKDINSGIKKVANVSSRSQLRTKDYEKAVEFINDWEPSTATKMLLRETKTMEV
jgi:anti-repressor protein